MKKFYFIIGTLLFLSACAVSNKFQPDEKNLEALQQKVPGTTVEQLREGMIIYKQSCASCHKLHAPSEFTQQNWEKTLHEMFPKARIANEAAQNKVRNYLYAMSK